MKNIKLKSNPLNTNIRNIIYKIWFQEKNYIMLLLKKTRIIYYYKLSLEKKKYTLFQSKKIGIYNLGITLLVLKMTFKQIMQISLFKGIVVVGGLHPSLTNMGKKLFYTFDKWYPGFITNFIKLMKHTLIYNHLKKKKNLLPLRNAKLKKTLQMPSYNISLKYQHYQLNEGHKLNMLQTTILTSQKNINTNFIIKKLERKGVNNPHLNQLFLKYCIQAVKDQYNIAPPFYSLFK